MPPERMPPPGSDCWSGCWLMEWQWHPKKPTSEAGRPCPTKFTWPERGSRQASITCPFDRRGKGRLTAKDGQTVALTAGQTMFIIQRVMQ